MKLVLDFTKFELGEIFSGLQLYAKFSEEQMKALQREQETALGKEWDVRRSSLKAFRDNCDTL